MEPSGGKFASPVITRLLRAGLSPSLRLGGAFLQLLATVLVARQMGATSAGEFFFWALILVTFGQISTFGLDRLILQRLPRFQGCGEERRRFLGRVRATSLILALGSGLLLIGYAMLFQGETERPAWWFLLLPLAAAGVALCAINGDTMIASGRPVMGIFLRHTASTFLFVLSICLLAILSRLSPNAALLGFTGSFVVAGLGGLLLPGFSGFGGLGSRIALPSPGEFGGLLKLGLPICLSSIFVGLSTVVPVLVVEHAHRPEQIAFLSTALRLFLLFEILSGAFHAFSLPELSRTALDSDLSGFWRVYRSALATAAVVLVPAMLLVEAFAGNVMSLFGPDFGVEATTILRVLIGFGLLSLLVGPATHLLLMTGRTRTMAVISFARTAASVLFCLLLVERYGAMGVAAVFGCGLVLEKLCCLVIVARAKSGGYERESESSSGKPV